MKISERKCSSKTAGENRVKSIVKSKSLTAEEILLNHHLEAAGLEVTETSLGEWIIQLRCEGPLHMVMPAIHLSRYQVADLLVTECPGCIMQLRGGALRRKEGFAVKHIAEALAGQLKEGGFNQFEEDA